MTAVAEITQAIIKAWNDNLRDNGLTYSIDLRVKCRNKSFEVSKGKSFELRIAELLLYKIPNEDSKEKTLLLFRKEMRMPDKVRNAQDTKYTSQTSIENSYTDSLYKQFLYETIGTFTIAAEQNIISKDYAEYDIEKERLKPNPEFEGMVIEVTEAGVFYEVGDSFDVFTQVEDGWGVYTAHDCARANNGIAKIPGSICKVIIDKKIDIEVVPEKKLKIELLK